MYFKDFPKMYYLFDIGDQQVLRTMVDITANVRLRSEILNNISVYDQYDLKDGETADIIAAKIYGNPEYHWAIMLPNEKYDHVEDFPRPYEVLNEYIRTKYNKFEGTWTYDSGDEEITLTVPDHTITEDWFIKDDVDIVVGRRYRIVDPGTSDFTTIGAANNTIGTEFTAAWTGSRPSAGTGTVKDIIASQVTLENVYVTSTDTITGEESIETGLNESAVYEISAVSDGLIVVSAALAVAGVPNGSLCMWTKNREYLRHDWITSAGLVVGDPEYAAPTSDAADEALTTSERTHFDYEHTLNDAKRRIKVISPAIISQVADELSRLIRA